MKIKFYGLKNQDGELLTANYYPQQDNMKSGKYVLETMKYDNEEPWLLQEKELIENELIMISNGTTDGSYISPICFYDGLEIISFEVKLKVIEEDPYENYEPPMQEVIILINHNIIKE